jgi:putative spermidine/putrescine transport system ATP-binding protein
VALARAIVFEPPILLMDEPLSALDRKLREHMQIELRRLHERLGVTTIYVTHDQREALTMSDRIVVMDGGRVAQVDSPRALYEWPRTRFVADFIGVSSFLPVVVAAEGVRCGPHAWSVEGAKWCGPIEPGARAVLVLRPESLCVVTDSALSLNRLDAIVRSVAYEGDAISLEAEAEGGVVLKARLPLSGGRTVPLPGSSLVLGWRPECAVVIPEPPAS